MRKRLGHLSCRSTLLILAAAIVLVGWLPGDPPASGEEARPALGETKVFARIPYPGIPGGLVVDDTAVPLAEPSLS